jgi:hypothetical protein
MMWVRLAVLGLLAGCAGTSPVEFDRRMTTYIGRPEADLIAGLGVPQRTYDGDGRRLLHYDLSRPSSTPSVWPSIGVGFGGGGFGRGVGVGTGVGVGLGGYGGGIEPCAVVFESRDGQVQGFSRNGPGCALPTA